MSGTVRVQGGGQIQPVGGARALELEQREQSRLWPPSGDASAPSLGSFKSGPKISHDRAVPLTVARTSAGLCAQRICFPRPCLPTVHSVPWSKKQ